MSDVTTVTALTNLKPNSCFPVNCSCNTMWSFVQEQCYLRMTQTVGDFQSDLLKDYAVRARRISGTYARFYLEQETHGDPTHKGRFYWMALGAFASKTVACTLESWQIEYSAKAIAVIKEGLGKGNFWLFCDIAGWHWYYSRFGSTFEMCCDSRNASGLDSDVKMQTKAMPWHAEALPKIKNHAVSKEIKLGFAKVKEFEGASEKKRPDIQMANLLAIANHEQGVILQPLIYDDPAFAAGVQLQRMAKSKIHPVEKINPAWTLLRMLGQTLTPELELVFSSACHTRDAKLKSVAPEDTKLENFESRMKWIATAAEQFHELMQTKTIYMEREIRAMAGWYQMPDKK